MLEHGLEGEGILRLRSRRPLLDGFVFGIRKGHLSPRRFELILTRRNGEQLISQGQVVPKRVDIDMTCSKSCWHRIEDIEQERRQNLQRMTSKPCLNGRGIVRCVARFCLLGVECQCVLSYFATLCPDVPSLSSPKSANREGLQRVEPEGEEKQPPMGPYATAV